MMDAKIVTAEEVKVQIETLQGPQGERGAQGPQGERGERGPQGIQGPAGARGEKGERGERGEKGATGERGPQGLPGRDGADGRDGAAGARGPQGAQGLQGERGEPGPAGRDGVDGIQGFSPIVDLERLDDGVLITVQNKDGNKIARVFDGKNAENKLEDIFIIHFNEYVNASQEPIEEIINAIDAGKVVIGVTPSGVIYEYAGLKTYINKASETAHTFQTHIDPFNRNAVSRFTQIKTDNSDFISSGQNISAKNPYKLILSGAVKAEYDGSKQVNITIPEGDTGGELFIVRYDPATKLADKTQAEIRAAVAQKTPCIALDSAGRVYSYVGEEPYHKDKNVLVPTFRHAMDYDEAGNVSFKELQIPGSGEMSIWGNTKVKAPNPKTLWIKGSGINALYDGSEQVTITLPEGGGEGGGLPEGGEPHQMLVTDGEGNAKWDERTHWKEEGLVDVLPEVHVEYNEDAGQFIIFEPFAMPIEVGKSYVVTYNGEEYTCVAKEFDMQGIPLVAVGNMGLLGGEETAEPFGLLVIPDEMSAAPGGASAMMGVNDGSTEVTIQIQHEGVVYHKLSPEFLPIPLTSDAEILPETTAEGVDGTLVITNPFASKIVVGKTYTVTYNGTDYTCRAFELPMDEEGTVTTTAVGNQAALGGEDTGEPFIIAYIPPEMVEMIGGYGMVTDMTGASSATIKILGEGDVKIDNSALDMDWIAKYDNVGETIVAETVGQGNGAEVAATDTSFFVEGNSFIAYVDNVRYDLTVVNYEGQLAAGNLGLVVPGAPGNGEPFYITAGDGKLTFFRAWGDDNDALHTIAVYLPGSSQRVPNQKLPNDFLSGVDVFYVELANGKINRRYDEILAAYEMGRTVCIRTYDDVYQKTDVYHLTHIYGNAQEMYFSQFLNGKMIEIVVAAYDFDTKEYDKVTIRGYDLNLPSAEGVGF